MRVVPTLSVQAGLAAMVVYDPERGADANEIEMLRAEAGIATGEVTIASRDVSLDGIDVRKGAWLGLAGGAAVASDESFDVVAAVVVEHLVEGGREILTLLTGEDEPVLESLLGELGTRHPNLEIEIHAGGQPHYPLLLSAE
jgi:dihydroxyacetone kinase-like predicted kinase